MRSTCSHFLHTQLAHPRTAFAAALFFIKYKSSSSLSLNIVQPFLQDLHPHILLLRSGAIQPLDNLHAECAVYMHLDMEEALMDQLLVNQTLLGANDSHLIPLDAHRDYIQQIRIHNHARDSGLHFRNFQSEPWHL